MGSLPWEFTAGGYCGGLPQEFTVGDYHQSLLWGITMGVYHWGLKVHHYLSLVTIDCSYQPLI